MDIDMRMTSSGDVVKQASAQVASSYQHVLRAAHYSAWDVKIPTQTSVNALTGLIQKTVSDIAAALQSKAAVQKAQLHILESEILEIMKQLGLPPSDREGQLPELVNWNRFQEPYANKEDDHD